MRTDSVRALLLLLLGMALLTSPVIAAAAQETGKGGPQEPMGNLVVILSTDELPKADAALRIAGVAAQRGHKVTLLLRLKAIQLALTDTSYKVGDISMQDKLANFMKGGSRVFVGGGCMKQEGISPQSLIPGVRVGTPDSVMGMIFEPGTRIICQ